MAKKSMFMDWQVRVNSIERFGMNAWTSRILTFSG